MKNQLTLFGVKKTDDHAILPSLPEENKQKIEIIFSEILLKYLTDLSMEINDDKK